MSGQAAFDATLDGLKAAAEPTRLRVLALLAVAELNVTDLTHILSQSQPRVSRHLKLLAEAGLIVRFREGAKVFHRLADEGAGAALARALAATVDPADPALASDRLRLDAVRAARAEAAAAYFRANAAQWNGIRSLQAPEAEVEEAMLALLGDRPLHQLVDLGTGTGRVLELFAPQIRKGVGVDLSPEMLSVARTALERSGHTHCQVRLGDIFALPRPALAAPGADAVVLHQVLHFLETPAAAVAEAARLLAPGGRLLIADFAPHDLEFLREAHAHRRLGFATREVETWLDAAGLALTATRVLPPQQPDEKLTVCVWLAERRAGARASAA